jgi:hypothetical protein
VRRRRRFVEYSVCNVRPYVRPYSVSFGETGRERDAVAKSVRQSDAVDGTEHRAVVESIRHRLADARVRCGPHRL